jgi:hypothetical protein
MSRYILAVIALLAAQLHAQTPAPAAPSVPPLNPSAVPLFRAVLPGGIYETAVKNIVAVSTHEYLVDGAARVTEVNIDTTGSILLRIYFIEPAPPSVPSGLGAAAVEKAQQYVQQATDKTGVDAWKKVIKNYPTTTHARTVEYRVGAKEDLDKVFKAAEEAFRLQKEKQVKIE